MTTLDPPSSYARVPELQLPSGQTIKVDRVITIGRAADNDIVLQDPTVSRYHCSISPSGEQLTILDRKSTSGTRVNGQLISSDGQRLENGDEIQLGAIKLQVQWVDVPVEGTSQAPVVTQTMVGSGTVAIPAIDVPLPPSRLGMARALYIRRGPGAPRVVTWDGTESFSIGRAPDSSLVVADDAVSRHHVEIQDRNGAPVVLDLGSANGTLLNGKRVATATELSSGDRINAGPLEIIFDPPLEGLGKAVLVLQGVGQYFLDREMTTIGRASNCDVVLPDPSVAPMEAQIYRYAADFWLFPMGDQQLMLSNVPVSGPTSLRSGDVLQIGTISLIFRQQETLTEKREAPVAEVKTLREIAPFSSLDEAAFSALMAAGEEVSFDARAELVPASTKKKAKDADFFVILSGRADVVGPVADNWENTSVVATLRPGDFCGERSLAYDQTWPYRVEAMSVVKAFRIRRKNYVSLIAKHPALGGFFKDKVARQSLVKYLREMPLFATVPVERLEELAKKIKLQKFPAGEVLVRQGEVVRTLFLAASGAFRVESVQRGNLTNLTVMHEGKYIGEQIAGSEELSPYTVVAETAGEAFVFTRDDYLKLAQESPEAFDFGSIGVPPSVVLERTPPFDTLAPEYVVEATRELRVKQFRAGETIIYQNDPIGSAFYVIARGSVDVLFRSTDGEERSLNKLKPGQCFGEGALLTNSPRNATVKAIEDCELLALYRREFNAIVAKSPMTLGPYLGHTFNSRFRPKHIDNVEIFEQDGPEGLSYIIKNLDRDTYANLSEQGLFIWNQLDGEHTMNDIAAAYFQRFKSLAMGAMFGTIQQLQQLGFLEVSMEEFMREMRGSFKPTRMQRAMMISARLMTVKKEFKHADRHFRALYNSFGKILFTKPALVLIALLNIAGIAQFARMLATGQQLDTIKASGWGILFFFAFQFFVVATHEMGHGMAMIHIGRKVLGAGFGWTYLSPLAFVNTTDAWLATKGQRLAVTAGGLLVSLSEASIATLLILVVHNELIKLALVEFSFLCFVGFIYNLAPVLPTDGYNFLMDVLQVPDLRPRAFNFIFSGQMFKALRNRPLTREQKAFTVFGLIVAVFMVLLAFNVAFTVLRLLGPTLRTHLPAAIAIAVQVVLITMVIGMFVLSILKEASIGARRAG